MWVPDEPDTVASKQQEQSKHQTTASRGESDHLKAHQHNWREASAARNNFHSPQAKRRRARLLWASRTGFVVVLAAVAALVGSLVFVFLSKAETDLAETQFESIADRALNEAVRIAQRKRYATRTMADAAGRMQPNASEWPFVHIDGFEELGTDLFRTAAVRDEVSIPTFGPLVTLEQQAEWEDYAYDYFENVANFPPGTAVNQFGRGIWSVEIVNGTVVRQHDTTGAVWGAERNDPYLFPAFQLVGGAADVLLFNLRYGMARATAIDSTISCAQKLAVVTDGSDSGCGSQTDMLSIFGMETRGPASVLYEPILPHNGGQRPTKATGIIATVLLLDETLDSLFSARVSGIDAVYTTGTETYTFSVQNGVAVVKGEGDLHDAGYKKLGRTRVLTNASLYTSSSPTYILSLYPTDQFYDSYTTSNPWRVSLGAVLAILFTIMLFFIFDCAVRQEFRAKRDLLEAKLNFLNFVSHEVRTPLNSICMGLNLIKSELGSLKGQMPLSADQQGVAVNPNLPEGGRSYSSIVNDVIELAEEVHEQAYTATDVLNDLLNYDKIESGNLRLELTLLPIWQLVKRTTREFTVPAANKNIDLQMCFRVTSDGQTKVSDIDVEAPPDAHAVTTALIDDLPKEAQQLVVVGDSVRMTQVLRNLISNAIKFTPAGGSIKVTTAWHMSTEESSRLEGGNALPVQGHQIQSRGHLIIRVIDTGVGMSVDQLEEVFGAGIQFEPNRLQGGGGSGLGLFIAKGIVEGHRGTLSVASCGLDQGTTFTVTLPVYSILDAEELPGILEHPCPPTTASPALPMEEIKSLRLLIADDSASNRKLLARLLRREGHECDECEDGLQAVEYVIQAQKAGVPYDALLLDYQMDVLDGPGTVLELRSKGALSQLVVIGITGNILPEDLDYFQNCGAHAVLAKPVNIPEVMCVYQEFRPYLSN